MSNVNTQVLPAYEVHPVPDEQRTPRCVIKIGKRPDGNNGGFEREEVEDDEPQFDVYFPRGHSVRLTETELKRQGFHVDPSLVDMESGEVMPDQRSVSLLRRSMQMSGDDGNLHAQGE